MQTLRFALPMLLAAAAVAQPVIVPSAAATGRPTSAGSWWNSNVLYGTATVANSQSHAQCIYDVNDVMLPVGIFNSFDFRRPGLNTWNSYLGNTNYAGTTNATIQMSTSATALASISGIL